jgi:hypothetical protein
MSRRRTRRTSRRPVYLLLLALGAVLVTVAVVLVMRPAQTAGGTPVISVEPASIDFGKVKLNTTKTFALTITNTGDGTLRFEEEPYLEVLEGC